MADQKVSDLPSLNGADVDPADLLYIIDSSAGSAGSKKITVGQYQLAPVSGGTANTVVYLNGSKVESSSSALTFDGSNLGIGTSSPATTLHVQSATGQARIQNTTSGPALIGFRNSATTDVPWVGTGGDDLRFTTLSTERARITSGGDLLVGTTTLVGAGGLSFQYLGSVGVAIVNNNNAAATGHVFSSFRRSSVEIGSITQNGTTAVLFNTTSDRRLKDNIAPAPSASDVIDAIDIVSHDWKAAPDEHVTFGVIAQDLALVAPQAVLQGDDGEEIKKTWGVDYSKLVPMLIKEIQSLRARVATLEAA